MRQRQAFRRNENGNIAVATAMAATMLLSAVGLGVDVAQLYHVRSNLQNALDAAVTSTARDLTTGRIDEDDARRSVEAFLEANGQVMLGGNGLKLNRLTVNRTNNTVEATASVKVDLYFPFIDRTGQRDVGAISAALYSDKQIEVAMMLDVTGSMKKTRKTDKIGDLKDAAELAVEGFLGNQDPNDPRVRLAIVPYAEAVNVGALGANAVFVETKGGPNIAPPSLPVSLSAGGGKACATERKLPNGKADFSDESPYAQRVNLDDRITRDRDDKPVCPDAELVALTADKQKLLDVIENFEADGVTAGGIAAQWGYYMLSPKWRTAIKDAGMGDGPANFDKKKIAKVAILMTDGQFNTAFAGVADNSRSPPQGHQGAKARAHAENICANMRRDGIEVYTIGFDLNNPGMTRTEREQAKTVLKNCATPDASFSRHYFEAATGEELNAAFAEIILNVERLAVTK